MSDTGNGTTFEIDDDAKDLFDPRNPITVYENGTPTSQDITIEYLRGRVVFPSAPTTPVTIDVNYFPKHQVGEVNTLTVEFSSGDTETPRLGDKGTNVTLTRHGMTASFTQFQWGSDYIDKPTNAESRYLDMILDETLTVFDVTQNFESSNAPRVRGLGLLTSDSVSIPESGVITGDFSFTSKQVNTDSGNLNDADNWRIKP